MSTDPSAMAGGSAPGGPAGPGGPGGQPSEEELRAAYEAELARITSSDMMLQAAVSLLNIASYRLAPRPASGPEGAAAGGGQDLDQVRDSVDGVRALLEILERRVSADELRPLREALSQLQMAYAREVQAAGSAAPAGDAGGQNGGDSTGDGGDSGQGGEGGQSPPGGSSGGAGGGQGGGQPGQGEDPSRQGPTGPGPAESSGRLWVPGR